MRPFIIHADYTGAFPLPWPFEFRSLHAARTICFLLNMLREMPGFDWGELKLFKVWD